MTQGPRWPERSSNRIAFVAEAWGQKEEIHKEPLVGPSGKEFKRMCRDAGIDWRASLLTNLIHARPKGNDFGEFCCKKRDLPPEYDLPAIQSGKYLKPEYRAEVDRLHAEIESFDPNVVVALGNTAMWALTFQSGIKKQRGTVTQMPSGRKVVPTFHPAAVLRDYKLRTVGLADLLKAKREAESPELKLRSRRLLVATAPSDLWNFYNQHMLGATLIAFDIETMKNEHITCLSVAPSPNVVLIVPFVDRNQPEYSYWRREDELSVWRWLRAVLEDPTTEKLAQNGTYDMQWLYWKAGIRVRNYTQDTMLAHHALWPELPKSLEFMGSVHCNEAAWKRLKPSGIDAKREE